MSFVPDKNFQVHLETPWTNFTSELLVDFVVATGFFAWLFLFFFFCTGV
jgi:hypothetical protein